MSASFDATADWSVTSLAVATSAEPDPPGAMSAMAVPSSVPLIAPPASATLVSRVDDAAMTVAPSSVTSRCSIGWPTVATGTTSGA
jgi:hypothetical protein